MQREPQPLSGIVPTPVGVNRIAARAATTERHCPHARGGEPFEAVTGDALTKLSPRPWG